ncbi:substrate-binding domain-containing protein [Massilia sp. PWRC2]|uniref:substrate-binding domain-containing protein n=1 Tax=Massilia sp. PWRC2 TaxID=2804626 RepID=UPI003CE80FFD
MSLHLRIGLDWVVDGVTVDVGALADLLAVVAASGTVQAAADQLHMSYRSVWGKLDSAETLLGQQLLVKRKGHGSLLSEAGSALLATVDAVRAAIAAGSSTELAAAQRRLEQVFKGATAPLNLFCSHDVALADCVQDGVLDGWAVRTMGSGKALDGLRAGKADLAGFHGPHPDHGHDATIAALRADPAWFVRPLMQRELGFVVASGNPLGIAGVADLVRAGIRLINRQQQSGTRAWLDGLISAGGIDVAAISGYRQEEFTHLAVVRAVAAGAADVGFAVKAATAGLAVDFIPVGTETYYLAGRVALADDARVAALAAAVGTRMLSHPGYAPVTR